MAPAPDPFAPWTLGPIRLRNRIVKAATFEGVMPNGRVTDELVAFHRRVAEGGAGLTTVAYCAVSPGGRVNRNTIVLTPEVVPDLRLLTDAVHAAGGAASAQIGHAGLVADVRSNRAPTLAPSRRFSLPAQRRVAAATDDDLDGVVADFERAAQVALDAGFDAIELHLGHGYLLSSFLSPRLNRRNDRWGGDAERRAAFPRRVVDAVAAVVRGSGRVALLAKLNMVDGVRRGLDVDGSLQVARWLEADGGLDALVLTGGSSLQNPMLLFRGDAPVADMADAQPGVAGWGVRVAGRLFFRSYPFAEAYFLEDARRFRKALSMPLVLLGGITRLETVRSALVEGFDAVALGRALLREPDLPRRWAAGAGDASTCVHCNRCMPSIYSGTRCVLDHPDSIQIEKP